MSETKPYIQALFAGKNISVNSNRASIFEEFAKDENITVAVKQILENQKMLTDKWTLINRVRDIKEQPVSIPNATVGKPYEALVDFDQLHWRDVTNSDFEGLDTVGLCYDCETKVISGTPTRSGDLKVTFKYKVEGEPEDSALNEKLIPIVINPDPKSLWKNIESVKTDYYWKEDNITAFERLGDKTLVAASKRGRSHANVGSFREDDLAYKYFESTGWSVVAVADGAGSAKMSRQGSKIACNSIVDYFSNHLTEESFSDFDILLKEYVESKGEETQKKLNYFVYNTLGQAALYAHKQLDAFATKDETPIKELHSTLIFTLFKKYEYGYAILSFGVGDCPIGLINKDLSSVTLMNWLDVGEFGGGTRFITMPDIFKSEKFYTRFNFKLIDDFSFLMLMTDGIYDPKFVVEANLEKMEKWQELLNDLNGENEDGVKVEFNRGNADIASQLSDWMDFWSSGNHDDRTLAIIF
ncbi:PP2C family serine/threonine-protein phosphatase [Pontibacter kalidii]|uniref:PP2C family serine/threonine-protein phosphatase n=1 Tax=Pontibacter kalidii TaxID=2592049 RepID=UPI0022554B93|nr:PP2C family serine/threonine-protein phosphatase [Pontibacter kalidii]